jgi:hypothetical protein
VNGRSERRPRGRLLAPALAVVACGAFALLHDARPDRPADRRGFASAGDGPLTLYGRVELGCGGGAGGAAAVVSLYEDAISPTAPTVRLTTDGKGRFAISGVREGLVHLVARGCGALFSRTHAVRGRGALGPFVLRPDGERRLAVHVTDSAGDPLAARLVVSPEPLPGDPGRSTWFPALELEADEQGWMIVSGLPAGPYAVSVRRAGHLPAELQRVEPGLEPIRVSLVGTSTIVATTGERGQDGDAGVLEGVSVRLYGPDNGISINAETGRDGTVRFDDLPPGRYLLDAVHGRLLTYSPVELDIGESETVEATLLLSPGLALEGVAVDTVTREAVEGACVVTSSRSESGRLACTSTDAKGRFRLVGLAPGRYTVVVQAAGYHRERVPSARVHEDAAAETLTVTLERSSKISGRVTDEQGRPVAGARTLADEQDRLTGGLAAELARLSLPVLVFEEPGVIPVGELGVTLGPVPALPLRPAEVPPGLVVDGGGPETLPAGCECLHQLAAAASADGVSDEDGWFVLGGMSPGETALLTLHPDYAPLRTEAVRVPAGGRLEPLSLVLGEGGVLGGEIHDTAGNPLEGAMVWVDGPSAAPLEPVAAGEDGGYRFDHVAGELTVTATCEGYFSASRTVTLEPGASSLAVDLELEPEGRIVTARVLGPWEYPVEDAAVTVASGSGAHALSRTVESDSDGVVAFASLPGPLWRIVVRHSAYRTLLTVRPPWEAGEEPELVLDFAGGVSGTVFDDWSYLPVEELSITVEREGERISRHTFDDGRFEIVDLPAGEVELVVEAPGYGSIVESVVLPRAGGPSEVTLPGLELWLSPLEPPSR